MAMDINKMGNPKITMHEIPEDTYRMVGSFI